MHVNSQASHLAGKAHTRKTALPATPRPSAPSPRPSNVSTNGRKRGDVYGSITVHDRRVTFVYGGVLETVISQIERMEREAAAGLKPVAWRCPAHLRGQAPRKKGKKKSNSMVGDRGKTDKRSSSQTKGKSARTQEKYVLEIILRLELA